MKQSFLKTGGLLLAASALAVSLSTLHPTTAQEATPEATAVVTMEPTRSMEGSGYVRLVNASPDTQAVDISFSGTAIATSLAFGSSVDFMEMPAGTYTVEVRAAGADTSAAAPVSKAVVLAPDVSTTLVVQGLSAGNPALDLGVFLTQRGPTQGKARVEVIHAIPDADKVDVLSQGKPVLTEIKFGHMGAAPLDLPPGSYDFQVAPSGQTADPVVSLPGTPLQADTIYTIVAIGQASNGSAKALTLTTTSPQQSAATPEATPTS
jgi:hypothetical protein